MGSLIVVMLAGFLLWLFLLCRRRREPRNREKEKIARLRLQYMSALQQGDVAAAEQCGRDYYCYLRNSRELHSFDEHTIQKDLAKMQRRR